MTMNPDQIEALSSMLNGGGGEDAPSRAAPPAPSERNNPQAGQDPLFKTVIKTGPTRPAAAAAPPPPPAKVDTRAIWSAEEIAAARELQEDDSSDGRRTADYDILYAQSLSSTDALLGLSSALDGDGTTRSSKAIVVKIKLPGADAKQISLDVTPTRLKLGSDEYKLFVHLPHTVFDQQGRAQWDARSQTLSVHLPIAKRHDDDE